MTITEKPWTRAKEVCKALRYDAKTSKTANIIKTHRNPENITQEYQMSSADAACTPINWPKDSQNEDIYINEEEMYELLFFVFFLYLVTGYKSFLTQKNYK